MAASSKKRRAAMKKKNQQAKNNASTSNGNGVLKPQESKCNKVSSPVSNDPLSVLSNAAQNISIEEEDSRIGDAQIITVSVIEQGNLVHIPVHCCTSNSDSNSSNSNDESQTIEENSILQGDSSTEVITEPDVLKPQENKGNEVSSPVCNSGLSVLSNAAVNTLDDLQKGDTQIVADLKFDHDCVFINDPHYLTSSSGSNSTSNSTHESQTIEENSVHGGDFSIEVVIESYLDLINRGSLFIEDLAVKTESDVDLMMLEKLNSYTETATIETSVNLDSFELNNKDEGVSSIEDFDVESQTGEKIPVHEGDSSIEGIIEPDIDLIKLEKPELEKANSYTEEFAVDTEPDVELMKLDKPAKVEALDVSELEEKDNESKNVEELIMTLSYELGMKEYGNKLFRSPTAPFLETSSIVVKQINDSQDYLENQTLLAAVPRKVRKASWTSCCGLFGVFTSSNR